MWKVGSPFPTCQFPSYMAKSLSDIHYSILSNELHMRMRRYNVFAQHLQPQFSNNVSQCIELFNIAMPPTNKVQKSIPFQHVQVQPQKEHNVSCRVDVQKIWADFLSHRVHILKKVLGNFSSTCPPSLGKDSSTPLYHDMFWLSFLEFLIWGPIPEDHGAIPLVCALVLAPQIFCRLVLHNWTSRPDMHWTCTGHKGKLS